MWRILFLLTLACWILVSRLPAQSAVLNQGDALLLTFSYGFQSPGGDLIDRFGNNSALGLGVEWITEESNWIFGLQGQFLFGNNVNEDVLAPLRTDEGFLIGNDRRPADLQLRQRGWYVGGEVGKILSLSDVNPRLGIRVSLGAGVLQHKIRIQEDPERSVPQTLGDYEKGYDRLSNGIAFKQFIGYQQLSLNRRINVIAGVEIIEAFTQSRRDFNFDTRSADTEMRLDLLFGFRVGVILPFYFGFGEEINY